MILCGNKCDLTEQRAVSEVEARDLAEKYGYVCLHPSAQKPLPRVFVKKAVATLFAKVCAGKCHAKSVLLQKPIFVNICKISCWTHLSLQCKCYIWKCVLLMPILRAQYFWVMPTDTSATDGSDPHLWIFVLLQNPILWDKCCKRAECQPGCRCPARSYHEEDGTMCWQVLDPRWDCPCQWSCKLRHGGRTREEQMCLLKW